MAAIRRLAAIVAADVVGYSRLMGDDEEGTLNRLNAHRRDLVDPKIVEHRGRIVKTTGDGLLAEFASVVDAVRCTVEIQRGMIERNVDLPEDQRMRFRVGINLGDIIIDRGDIFGDGVNIAARLEALAEPGGMCISGTARDHVGDRLPYPFEDIGEQVVKNIARPVPAFALSNATIAETPLVATKPLPRFGRLPVIVASVIALLIIIGFGGWHLWPATPSATTAVTRAPPRLSIVVLPFENASNDPDQDYLVDAVTGDITANLSRITGAFVISRATAFTYKGKHVDTKQIGRDLGVRYVLEGSARRDNQQVQVHVQLIDSESGVLIWSDKFDVDRGNLKKAQDQIITHLVRSLQIKLVDAAARRIEREQPVNPDADDFVMRGWSAYYRLNSTTNLNEAQKHFERALEIDPRSFDAKIGLASVLSQFVANGRNHIVDGVDILPAEDLARSEKLLLAAMEQDSNDPKLFYELGNLRRLQNRFSDAKILLEKSIQIDPNNVQGFLFLGMTFIYLGEPEQAIPCFQRNIEVSPESPNIFFAYWWLADAYLLMGETDQAIEWFTKARALNPEFAPSSLFLAAALGLKGDIDEAKVNLAEGLKLRPEPNTIKKFLNSTGWQTGTPKFFELRDRTVLVGWRHAGLPEE
jgi:adenylate cyclase